jgi:UDPglucose--hexose-1-phosphate uridylyltransferase
MSEFRQDPISGQWVIVAPERASRPDEFARDGQARAARLCPFCAGNEHLTPAPLLEIPSSPGSAASWRIRVLTNKYPAVTADGETGFGQHEVVVESPEHLLGITELSESQFADVVLVYRDRLRTLAADGRLKCGLVFKNMGAGGGATLEHIHSQIVALPTVPDRLQLELNGAAQWQAQHGGCAFCAIIEQELSDGTRIVACDDSLVAMCPVAARTPYETWILPRRHESHFEQTADALAGGLARLLMQIVGAVAADSRSDAYNYLIHSAPFDTPPGDHYHWHVEVIPRLTRLAGFEWAAGWNINPVTPEEAALRLRNLLARGEEKRSSAVSLPIS